MDISKGRPARGVRGEAYLVFERGDWRGSDCTSTGPFSAVGRMSCTPSGPFRLCCTHQLPQLQPSSWQVEPRSRSFPHRSSGCMQPMLGPPVPQGASHPPRHLGQEVEAGKKSPALWEHPWKSTTTPRAGVLGFCHTISTPFSTCVGCAWMQGLSGGLPLAWRGSYRGGGCAHAGEWHARGHTRTS